jgi:hypothetical protein
MLSKKHAKKIVLILKLFVNSSRMDAAAEKKCKYPVDSRVSANFADVCYCLF